MPDDTTVNMTDDNTNALKVVDGKIQITIPVVPADGLLQALYKHRTEGTPIHMFFHAEFACVAPELVEEMLQSANDQTNWQAIES